MSNRTLILLLVVFVALIAAATAPTWWPGDDDAGETTVDRLELDELDDRTTTQLTITKGRQAPRVLINRNGSWTISGQAVPKERINELFAAFEASADAEVVGRNKDNHKRYGVTERQGIVLRVERGDASATYVIGNEGGRGLSYYAVRSGSDEVYDVRGELRRLLEQTQQQWRTSGSAATSG